MVGYLFDGSFKRQIQFQQFVRQYEEAQTIVILEPVPVESTAELQPPSTSGEPAHRRLPVVTVIPTFPKDVQARLDAKESCQKVPKLLNKIIRVLYEMMAEYTMYPTNAEYVQVAKAVIVKYPFLKDNEGNGYHTWHMSLKRRFKAERAPLVSDTEVRKLKEKFGHKKQSKATVATSSLCRNPASVASGDPATPHPTIQLMDNDWMKAISGRGFSVVKVDGIGVCQCTNIDEAFITAFSMYFTFNIAYPAQLKKTLTFLQRRIISIMEEGDKPLPVTLLQKINLLY
ncbi:hypothetical protein IRJ41_009482 [Triplophysa rosa]|uniref:Sterile alpha motif domain-containing protein 3 n=1 Tax=Triplophysa rosa TaxID=992332 RepID=A0A9W7WFL4_TRIRA|nr:hypothetical protein IRJ41_009482 [Triplophysa rosa]